MNLFTAAETVSNYANAGAGKAKLPISKMLVLGILAGMLIGFPSCVTNMATFGITLWAEGMPYEGVHAAMLHANVVYTGSAFGLGTFSFSLPVPFLSVGSVHSSTCTPFVFCECGRAATTPKHRTAACWSRLAPCLRR